MKVFALCALALTLFVLHQDFWNWASYEPLVFGFLPFGLAYHGVFSILCGVMMIFFVKFAWPAHLEDEASARGPGAKP